MPARAPFSQGNRRHPSPARRLPRAALAALTAGLLLVAPTTAGAQEQDGDTPEERRRAAEEEPFSVRLGGADRYETAEIVATDSFASSDVVLLATGERFPDALAANYLAGQREAPVLLTFTDRLNEHARDGLEALDPQEVVILGGPEAVSPDVEEELADDYEVTRHAGQHRYETALDIARAGDTVGTHQDDRTALLATGERFPDALTSSPVAYAQQFPVLLTTQEEVSPEVTEAIDELDLERIIIVGGERAVSNAVEQELTDAGVEVERVSGAERTGTSIALADYAQEHFGFSFAQVGLARGDLYPDALTAGPHTGRTLSPIVLTQDSEAPTGASELGRETNGFFARNCPDVDVIIVFGGPVAVSAEAEDQAVEQATCPSDPEEGLEAQQGGPQ